MRRLFCLLVGLCLLTLPTMAQDAEDDSPSNMYSAWTVTDLLAEEDDDPIENLVVFLEVDSSTMIEVWAGADVVYTLQEDGTYSGATLLPVGYDFSATLTVIDEDTYETVSEISSGTYTSESNLRYSRTDMSVGVWIEPERDLQEYSLFNDCIGASGGPPLAYSQPDPILTILIDEEAGQFLLGTHILTGAGTYELEEEDMFGTSPRVTTQTAIVSEDVIDFAYYAIADGRDDCELIYETQFLAFDGNFEPLFEIVDTLSEPEDD